MSDAAVVAQASGLLSLLDQASSSSSKGTTDLAALHRLASVHGGFLEAISSNGLLSSLESVAAKPQSQSTDGKSGSTAGSSAATASSLLAKLTKRATVLLQTDISRKQPSDVLCKSLGFSLALSLTKQIGWPILSYESTATTWLSAGLQLVQAYSAPTGGIASDVEARLLRDAISLVGEEVLRTGSTAGKMLSQGGEFMRTIVTPNVPKYAGILVGALDGSVKRGDVYAQEILFQAISSEIHFRATIYRPHSARIYNSCIASLFSPELSPYNLPPSELVKAASRLLIDLHRTGAINTKSQSAAPAQQASTAGLGFVYDQKAGSAGAVPGAGPNSRATQAQLWQATVHQALGTFQLFAEACTSCIIANRSSNSAAKSSDRWSDFRGLHTFPLAEGVRPDPHMDSSLQHTSHLKMLRYSLFVLLETLGRASSPNAIVSLPLSSFLQWALRSSGILRMTKNHSVQQPGSETSMFVLQMTSLGGIVQTSVLLVLLKLLGMADRGAILELARTDSEGESNLLWTLVDLYESCSGGGAAGSTDDSQLSSTLLRVLALLVSDEEVGNGFTFASTLPLEPSSTLVRRLARISASNVARFLLGSSAGKHRMTNINESADRTGSSARGRKRAKGSSGGAFETDTMFNMAGAISGDGNALPTAIAEQEAACVLASFDILAATYPHLTTGITGEHSDLATLVAALARASLEALHTAGVVIPASSPTSPMTHAGLVNASARLLDVVLQHSTSKTLAAIIAGLPSLLTGASLRNVHGQSTGAIQRCLQTVQKIAQPRLMPVPEWTLDVQELATGIDEQEGGLRDSLPAQLEREDMLCRSFLADASEKVLGLAPVTQAQGDGTANNDADVQVNHQNTTESVNETAPAKPQLSLEPSDSSAIPVASSLLELSPPRQSPTLVRSSPRNFSPDPVKPIRTTSNASSTTGFGRSSANHPQSNGLKPGSLLSPLASSQQDGTHAAQPREETQTSSDHLGTKDATEKASEPAAEAPQQNPEETELTGYARIGLEDDSDDEMPSIDPASSDEEEGDEEEEENPLEM